MISLDNISIHLPLKRGKLRRRLIAGRSNSGGEIIYIGTSPYVAALQSVTLDLEPGDTVALIGKNGSGKTTLLRTIAGIYHPTRGHVETHGSIATMFSSALTLSDRETGRQNIEFSGILRGLDYSYIQDNLERIVETCGLGNFIDVPVSMYSNGMCARLGLAMAIIAKPDILLIDEAMMAADTHFIDGVATETGLFHSPDTICIMATHAKSLQDKYCNKAIWLDHGHLKAIGDYQTVKKAYEAPIDMKRRADD